MQHFTVEKLLGSECTSVAAVTCYEVMEEVIGEQEKLEHWTWRAVAPNTPAELRSLRVFFYVVQLGAVFCVHLVFLMKSNSHKGKTCSMLNMYQSRWNKFLFSKEGSQQKGRYYKFK